MRRALTRTQSFPRTTAVIGFLVFSGAAQLQTLVNLHP